MDWSACAAAFIIVICITTTCLGQEGSYLEFGDCATRGLQVVEFNVTSPTPGDHAVLLLYQSPAERVVHASIDGGPRTSWSLPAADTWTVGMFTLSFAERDSTLLLEARKGDFTGLKLSAIGISGSSGSTWLQAETSSKYSGPTLSIDSGVSSDAQAGPDDGGRSQAADDSALAAKRLTSNDGNSKEKGQKLHPKPISQAPPAASQLRPAANFTIVDTVQQPQQEQAGASSLFIAVVIAMAALAGLLLIAVLINVVCFFRTKPGSAAFLTHVNPVTLFRRITEERGMASEPAMQGAGGEIRLSLAVESYDLQQQEEMHHDKKRCSSFAVKGTNVGACEADNPIRAGE